MIRFRRVDRTFHLQKHLVLTQCIGEVGLTERPFIQNDHALWYFASCSEAKPLFSSKCADSRNVVGGFP